MTEDSPTSKSRRTLAPVGPLPQRSEVVDDSGDDVPVYRTPTRRERRARGHDHDPEDSRSFARAGVDLVDDLARRQFGAGFNDEIKTIVATTLERQLNQIVRRAYEDRTTEVNTASVPAVRAESRWSAIVLAMTVIGLVLSILLGAFVALRLADRLSSLDTMQRERIATMEARITEAQNRQIELETQAKAQQAAIDLAIKDHERRVALLEARQMALIVYLMESVGRLLKDRNIPVPEAPPILRIAEAEAEAFFKPQQSQRP